MSELSKKDVKIMNNDLELFSETIVDDPYHYAMILKKYHNSLYQNKRVKSDDLPSKLKKLNEGADSPQQLIDDKIVLFLSSKDSPPKDLAATIRRRKRIFSNRKRLCRKRA